jgi:hypothetical protein
MRRAVYHAPDPFLADARIARRTTMEEEPCIVCFGKHTSFTRFACNRHGACGGCVLKTLRAQPKDKKRCLYGCPEDCAALFERLMAEHAEKLRAAMIAVMERHLDKLQTVYEATVDLGCVVPCAEMASDVVRGDDGTWVSVATYDEAVNSFVLHANEYESLFRRI